MMVVRWTSGFQNFSLTLICIFYFSSHGVNKFLQNFNKQQFVNQHLTRLLEQYAGLQKQHFYPSYSQYYSLLCISPSNEFDEIFIYNMHVAYVLTLDTPRADQIGLENDT